MFCADMMLNTVQQVQQAPVAQEVPTDPTAYYNDFWLYCSYYGEPAARAYYGAWSPPEGTPAPAGTVMPSAAVPPAAPSAPTPAEPTPAAPSSEPASSSEQTSTSASTTATTPAAATQGTDDVVLADPVAQASWEAYKKQYAEWYEAHGKASGADPNPPRPEGV